MTRFYSENRPHSTIRLGSCVCMTMIICRFNDDFITTHHSHIKEIFDTVNPQQVHSMLTPFAIKVGTKFFLEKLLESKNRKDRIFSK